MRYFFRRKIPAASDILMIESGSPEVARRALERIRNLFPGARYHLCTCQADAPNASYTSVYRAADYPTAWKKLGLLSSFCRRGWNILVILCTGEPILLRWKIMALAMLPSKVLIVNEHADFFWLDWENRRTLRKLASIRWGVNLEEFFATLLRAIVFPITLLILLVTAGLLYSRRGWRLLMRRINRGAPASGKPPGTSRASGGTARPQTTQTSADDG
jgi:hypothetical protein